jgi:hypothetical protein
MKLNTGKVAFPIEFDNGDKQTIFFNPNDPDLMIRMKNLENKVSEKIKGLEDVELNNSGEPVEFSQIETFEKMQNIIKEELDVAFGGSVSDVVFKHCSPFAIVGGEYFVVQFIQAVTPEIEKHIKKANAEVEKKMSKHIGKYQK